MKLSGNFLTYNKKPIIIFSFFIILLLSSILSGFLLYPNSAKGIYTIILKISDDNKSLCDYLETKKRVNIFSRYSNNVKFNLFGEELILPVNEINKYLLPFDPRLTFFSNNAENLFLSSEKNREIFYIKSKLPPLFLLSKIKKTLDKYAQGWISPELSFISASKQIVLTIIFAICLIMIFRKFKIVLMYIMPWLGLVFVCRYDLISIAFAITILFAVFSEIVMRQLKYGETKTILKALKSIPAGMFFPAGIAVLCILFALTSGTAIGIITAITALCSNLTIFYIYVEILIFSGKLYTGTKFIYKSLKGKENIFNFKRNIKKDGALCGLLIIMFILTPQTAKRENYKIPQFNSIPLNYKNLSKYDDVAQANKLPQAGDYISHEIYQKYYRYGFKEHFPEIGETFIKKRISLINGKVNEENETLAIFTESYYSSIIKNISGNNVAGLLFTDNRINLVAYKSPFKGFFRNAKWWQNIFASIITFIPFFLFYFFTYPVFYGSPYSIEARRKKQTA